jgi:hypothetical protein
VHCLVLFLHLVTLVERVGLVELLLYSWCLLTPSQPGASGIIEQLLVIVTSFDHSIVRGS